MCADKRKFSEKFATLINCLQDIRLGIFVIGYDNYSSFPIS